MSADMSLHRARFDSASANAGSAKNRNKTPKNYGHSGPSIMSMLAALAAVSMTPPSMTGKPAYMSTEDLARMNAINTQVTNLYKHKKELSDKIDAAKKTRDKTAKSVEVALRELNLAEAGLRSSNAMHANFAPLRTSVEITSGAIVPNTHFLIRPSVNLLFAAVSLVAVPIDMARSAIIRTSGDPQIYARIVTAAEQKHKSASLVHQSFISHLSGLETEFTATAESLAQLSSILDSIIKGHPSTAATAAPIPSANQELSADMQILFGDD